MIRVVSTVARSGAPGTATGTLGRGSLQGRPVVARRALQGRA